MTKEKSQELILFWFDTPENFALSQVSIGRKMYQDVILIEDIESLDKQIEKLKKLYEKDGSDPYVHLAVHVFHAEDIRGVRKFNSEGILGKYPDLGVSYISSGSATKIYELLEENRFPHREVERYHLYMKVNSNELAPIRLSELLKKPKMEAQFGSLSEPKPLKYPQCNYVIVTALEEEEMEPVLPMIEVSGKVDDDTHLIKYGFFKLMPDKLVAFASQPATGMIDAAILTTKMIQIFNPKFVIMCGVLGGRPGKTNIGDVLVSNKVFTIDKGKLVDGKGIFSTKKFEAELELTNTESAYVTDIQRNKTSIETYLVQEEKKFQETSEVKKKTDQFNSISLRFGPIACVRSVIDQKGFFEESVVKLDRKVIGLEMESYGVARACEQSKHKNVIPLIIKSVMDNTSGKDDEAKKLAARNSAKVVEYAVLKGII